MNAVSPISSGASSDPAEWMRGLMKRVSLGDGVASPVESREQASGAGLISPTNSTPSTGWGWMRDKLPCNADGEKSGSPKNDGENDATDPDGTDRAGGGSDRVDSRAAEGGEADDTPSTGYENGSKRSDVG